MDYPGAYWTPSPNFGYPRGTQGRRDMTQERSQAQEIVAIIDHIEQGFEGPTIAEFGNPQSEASSTYSVAEDGTIRQHVRESDAAWANGIDFSLGYLAYKSNVSVLWIADCWTRHISPNLRTISIEHEGFTGNAMPEVQYRASLALKRSILERNPSIPRTPLGLLGHHDIDSVNRPFCPGSGNPRARFLADLGMA